MASGIFSFLFTGFENFQNCVSCNSFSLLISYVSLDGRQNSKCENLDSLGGSCEDCHLECDTV